MQETLNQLHARLGPCLSTGTGARCGGVLFCSVLEFGPVRVAVLKYVLLRMRAMRLNKLWRGVFAGIMAHGHVRVASRGRAFLKCDAPKCFETCL